MSRELTTAEKVVSGFIGVAAAVFGIRALTQAKPPPPPP